MLIHPSPVLPHFNLTLASQLPHYRLTSPGLLLHFQMCPMQAPDTLSPDRRDKDRSYTFNMRLSILSFVGPASSRFLPQSHPSSALVPSSRVYAYGSLICPPPEPNAKIETAHSFQQSLIETRAFGACMCLYLKAVDLRCGSPLLVILLSPFVVAGS